MKRLTVIAAASVLAVGLAACSSAPKSAESPNQKPAGNESAALASAAPNDVQNDVQTEDSALLDMPSGSDNTDEAHYSLGDYNSAAAFYRELTQALCDKVDGIVYANNQKIEEANPENYDEDPNYLLLLYVPFVSANMQAVPAVGDGADEAAIAAAYTDIGYLEVEYEKLSDNEYRISYKDIDETGATTEFNELMSYQADSIRYERQINGKVAEFFEFISLGESRYALQSESDRAIVKYENGSITELLHAENRYEVADPAFGILTSWSVMNDPISDSIRGRTELDESWVLEKQAVDGVRRIFELRDGKLTISGYTQTGMAEDTVFTEMTPIVINENEQ